MTVTTAAAAFHDRMAARIVNLVPDEKVALEHLKRTLEKARQSRYDIRSIR